MSNKKFLKEFGGLCLLVVSICVGLWFFIENVDYVETDISSLDFEAGTVNVVTVIYIDSDPVKGYSKTVDYCDRKTAKKEMKAEAKVVLREFKKGNCE